MTQNIVKGAKSDIKSRQGFFLKKFIIQLEGKTMYAKLNYSVRLSSIQRNYGRNVQR